MLLGSRGLIVKFLAAVLAAIVAAGCDSSPRMPEAAQRGQVFYRTNCASCHNRNPNLPGPIGPAIAGSPRALVEARVLHRSYPPGYHAKRSTHLMLPLPWMAGHIGDLTAYLQAADTDRRSSNERQ
jgi:mono/diheme cytochrome c family protein